MMPRYDDKEIRCDCGDKFTWTKGEQKFMNTLLQQSKIKKVVAPVRCPDCRRKKREYFGDENKN